MHAVQLGNSQPGHKRRRFVAHLTGDLATISQPDSAAAIILLIMSFVYQLHVGNL